MSRDGSNALNLLKAARLCGLEAKGFQKEPNQLLKMKLPAIIHWEFNHFVVLTKINRKKAYINDPARGEVVVTSKEFDKSFTGVVLTFERGKEFVKEGARASIIKFIRKRLKNAKQALFFALLSGLLAAFVSISLPLFSQIFIDNIITGQNPEWFTGFMFLFCGIILFQFILQSVDGIYNLKLRGKLSIDANANFFWHVIRLPINFFSQRYIGDILSRQMDNQHIPSVLVKQLAPMLVNISLLILYLYFMIRYNAPLAMIAAISAIINLCIISYVSDKLVNLNRLQERNNGRLQGVIVSSLQCIETIKAAGAETGFFQRWAGHFATMSNSQVKYNTTNAYLSVVPLLLQGISNSLVLILGCYYILTGELTIGMLIAFQGFMGAFLTPVTELMSSYQGVITMRTQMERVEDVYRTECDVTSDLTDDNELADGMFSGHVELRNVTFGYSILSEPLLENFSLELKPGKSVAFVGSSGCGKSTLAKLISGLYTPWSGEILFDGKSKEKINHREFVTSVSIVDQNIILFDGTISDNIKMWNESIEDFAMIIACHDAQVHTEIVSRPLGYDLKIEQGGSNFSGGQRQRMEIASALAKEPLVLILDEATSALDAQTEEAVMKSIKKIGISLIIIAHRLSTIRDCDEIIVLDQGQIVERGTHTQLLENKGMYYRLMENN